MQNLLKHKLKNYLHSFATNCFFLNNEKVFFVKNLNIGNISLCIILHALKKMLPFYHKTAFLLQLFHSTRISPNPRVSLSGRSCAFIITLPDFRPIQFSCLGVPAILFLVKDAVLAILRKRTGARLDK